jgi:putative ABC transport system permease protein
VAERTKEIGIRKAIGAGRRRILLQFLIESLVISVLGGIIGILISWGLLAIVSVIADMSFTMTGGVIALAVGFSVFVGVVFGLYPANKASKLQPIQALRSE